LKNSKIATMVGATFGSWSLQVHRKGRGYFWPTTFRNWYRNSRVRRW